MIIVKLGRVEERNVISGMIGKRRYHENKNPKPSSCNMATSYHDSREDAHQVDTQMLQWMRINCNDCDARGPFMVNLVDMFV